VCDLGHMRTPEIVTVTTEWWTWQGEEKKEYIYIYMYTKMS